MKRFMPALLALAPLLLVGCEDKPNPNAKPTSSALAPAAPKSEASKAFAIDAATSKVNFQMDAAIEKIYGEADGSGSGELFVDLEDISKSTGLLKVDLDKLVVYQQKRENETAEFGERSKSDLQNEHVRDWLHIGKDVPEAEKQKYRYIEFKVTKIEPQGPKRLADIQGAERKMAAKVTGDFRLNERTVQKTGEVELTFKMEGDKPVHVSVKSTKPIAVNLEEHDVRPRNALGTILQKTTDELATLGKKVSKDSMVSFDFTAKAK
jgi:polyisoprenoid-binding protein YceI